MDVHEAPTAHEGGVWQLATPLQLLRLLKLCGIEGTVIAARVGVKPPLISMWLHERQPVPQRHRPVLLAWAQQTEQEYLRLRLKEAQAAPTPALRQAAIERCTAPLHEWKLRVAYEAGNLHDTLRREAAMLFQDLGRRPLHLQGIRTTLEVMLWQVATIEALEAEGKTAAGAVQPPVEPAQGAGDER